MREETDQLLIKKYNKQEHMDQEGFVDGEWKLLSWCFSYDYPNDCKLMQNQRKDWQLKSVNPWA
jgi:hypothetical protein